MKDTILLDGASLTFEQVRAVARSLWLIDHAKGEAKCVEVTGEDEWLTWTAETDSADFSAVITLSKGDARGSEADPMFDGVARVGEAARERAADEPRGSAHRNSHAALPTRDLAC